MQKHYKAASEFPKVFQNPFLVFHGIWAKGTRARTKNRTFILSGLREMALTMGVNASSLSKNMLTLDQIVALTVVMM